MGVGWRLWGDRRAPCHNLCLKKHEFFRAQRQRWHFMFTTIISLVNDSCGCGAYESFREQTETLALGARRLSSLAAAAVALACGHDVCSKPRSG